MQCLKQGIEFYTDEGRFSIAAKHQKELAELYEDQSDLENAIAAYQVHIVLSNNKLNIKDIMISKR